MIDLRGRTALVTGGGNGLGAAIAGALHAEGASVVVAGRREGPLQQVCAELGERASWQVCDVADPASVSALAESLAGVEVDVLVNNAGVAGPVAPLTEISVEEWDEVFDVNVRGVFLVCRAFLPAMMARGRGDVVNIASVSGIKGNMGRTAYGASKGAVITMTKVMAVELAESGIRVNAVAPGPVDTPMVQAVHTSAAREAWLRHVPMRRYAAPDEIAGAIVYLLDDSLSSYVTGHILAVDGGFVAGGTVRSM